MVTQRRLPRSSWWMLLALVAAVLTCHGIAATFATQAGHGTHAVQASAGEADLPPCHSTDDGQRADGGDLTCAAPAVGTGSILPGNQANGYRYTDDTSTVTGVHEATSADRGPPALAELQLLRI